MKKRVVILDFDGVLIDSSQEVLVSAYNTASDELLEHPDQLSQDFKELFTRYRPLPKSAGEIVLLAKICLRKDKSFHLSSEVFHRELNLNSNLILEFEADFFKRRELLISKSVDSWLNLNIPYSPFFDFIKDQDFVILTYKNPEAVLRILTANKLEIEPARVFSGIAGVGKLECFLNITKSFPAHSYLFIDDAVRNLEVLANGLTVHNIDLSLHLAAWGYTNDESRKIASSSGFNVLNSQEEAIDLIRAV